MQLATERNLPGKRIDRATVPGAPWQSVRLVNDAVRAASSWVAPLRTELKRAVVGQKRLIDRLLICLLADGHLLIDGGPGLAKSRTVKSLATAIGADCQRIPLSSDMAPSDLFGDLVIDQDTGIPTLGPGSIFAHLVLAEDLHLAPPMVQNALLMAMEERSVTMLGEAFSLSDPFMVVATTQRESDKPHHPLSHSQADRFLMQVVLEYPSSDEERVIIDVAGNGRRSPVVRNVLSLEELLRARRVVHSVYADRMIKEYAVALVSATRGPSGTNAATRGPCGHGVTKLSPAWNACSNLSPDRNTDSTLTAPGASPRATVDLIRAARATAFLAGRGYVTPQDVKAVATDVLRHRLTLRSRAEAAGITTGDVIRGILDTVAVP